MLQNLDAALWSILTIFWNPEAQTVLPDMSVLIGQKLVEKANIQWYIFKE